MDSKQNDPEPKSEPKPKASKESNARKKKPGFFTRVLNKMTRPSKRDLDIDHFRLMVVQNHRNEKNKLKRRRTKQILKKLKEKERLRNSVGSAVRLRSSGSLRHITIARASKGNIHHSIENLASGSVHSLELLQSGSKSTHSTLRQQVQQQISQTEDKDEIRFQRFYLEQIGPSHFSAQSQEQDLLKKHKENRKRKISQLYAGDVYHHSLSQVWDHADPTKFYRKLDSETRKKYPITPEIRKEMEKIKKKREAKLKAKEHPSKFNTCIVTPLRHLFYNSNIGYVFKTTPRYSQMTPVTPIHCRRCRYKLEDTLKPKWTPLGVTFAILFPILGILCCVANREFVCVVCEEVYLFGDYPSRCRPLDKNTLVGSDTHFHLKRRSFKRGSVAAQ